MPKGQEYCQQSGKICYDTRLAAEKACAGMKRNGRKDMSVYPCDACWKYHTTSIGYSHSKDYELTIKGKVGLGLLEEDMGKRKNQAGAKQLQGAFDDGIRIAYRNFINKAEDWLYDNEDMVTMCDINTIVRNFKAAMEEAV